MYLSLVLCYPSMFITNLSSINELKFNFLALGVITSYKYTTAY